MKNDKDTQIAKVIVEQSKLTDEEQINNGNTNIICNHEQIVKYNDQQNCLKCGVQLLQGEIKAFKSQKYNYKALFSTKRIFLRYMNNCLNKEIIPIQTDYLRQRRKAVDYILELSESLNFFVNTSYLGIYLLDIVARQDQQVVEQLKLFSIICLLVASKAIELDNNIPFISKIRKYGSVAYSPDEYRKAEVKILNFLQFQVQIPTIIDLLNYYLSQGIIFSNDEVDKQDVQQIQQNENNARELKENTNIMNNNSKNHPAFKQNEVQQDQNDQDIIENQPPPIDTAVVQTTTEELENLDHKLANTTNFSCNSNSDDKKEDSSSDQTQINQQQQQNDQQLQVLAEKFEQSLQKLVLLTIKDDAFLEYDQNIIISSCIVFLRKIYKIFPIWSNQLHQLTGLEQSLLEDCINNFIQKFESHFVQKEIKQVNTFTSLKIPENLVQQLEKQNQHPPLQSQELQLVLTSRISDIKQIPTQPQIKQQSATKVLEKTESSYQLLNKHKHQNSLLNIQMNPQRKQIEKSIERLNIISGVIQSKPLYQDNYYKEKRLSQNVNSISNFISLTLNNQVNVSGFNNNKSQITSFEQKCTTLGHIKSVGQLNPLNCSQKEINIKANQIFGRRSFLQKNDSFMIKDKSQKSIFNIFQQLNQM